jgi:hypothetical protein
MKGSGVKGTINFLTIIASIILFSFKKMILILKIVAKISSLINLILFFF